MRVHLVTKHQHLLLGSRSFRVFSTADPSRILICASVRECILVNSLLAQEGISHVEALSIEVQRLESENGESIWG